MKKILIGLCLSLTACGVAHVPVAPDPVIPPALPSNLAQKAGPLPPLTDPTMGGLQVQAAKDDAQYNSVAWQLNEVIDVYNCVRTAIMNKTDVKKCL